MARTELEDDCISKKPWSEVLSRSLKLFTFNLASEGGKSFGRVVFYIVLAALVLGLAAYIIDSMTGLFSSWFDFWPFNAVEDVVAEPASSGWFSSGATEAKEAVAASEEETKWYCKWNPAC